MESRQFAGRFLRLVSLYGQAEDKPAAYGAAGELTRAEIHFIEFIGDHPGASVTGLARLQGTSKSAVSQMLAKLKAKGLVFQKKASGSDRDTELSLTKVGHIAYREHEAYHSRLYAELDDCVASIGEDAAGRVLDLFDRLEEFLRRKALEE